MAEKEPQQSSVVDPLEGNPPISEVGGQEEVDLGTAKRKKSKKLKQDPRLIVDGEWGITAEHLVTVWFIF